MLSWNDTIWISQILPDSGKVQWPISLRWFCSVTSPCITEVMHLFHPLHRAQTKILWKFRVNDWNFYLSLISICHSAAAVPFLKRDKILPVCGHIVKISPAWITCNWKICVLIAAFCQKIQVFHLGWSLVISTLYCAVCMVMPQSACSIMLLLPWYVMELPSECQCKKPSKMAWKTKISPATGLLGWSPESS